MPNSTPQQVSLILTAAGACNATTLQAIKTALIALMSDPTTMYGVYTPNLVVDVGCLETGAFQVGVVCECHSHQAEVLPSAWVRQRGTSVMTVHNPACIVASTCSLGVTVPVGPR